MRSSWLRWGPTTSPSTQPLVVGEATNMRLSIKVSFVLWVIALVTFLGYAVSRLLFFKQIFFEHAGIAITQDEVSKIYNATSETRTQYIPKIVHQVFHNWHDPGNDALPSDWVAVRQGCMGRNPGFDFKVRH